MDRGSFLFPVEGMPDGLGKICTEFDIIQFEDGEQATINQDGAAAVNPADLSQAMGFGF